MLIIDKNKDFYDHYSRIYGIDKTVVFDRRNSVTLNDSDMSDYGKLSYRGFDKSCYFLLETGITQYLIKYYDFNIFHDKKSLCDVVKSYKIDLIKTFNENINISGNAIALYINVGLPFTYITLLWDKKDRARNLFKSLKLSDVSWKDKEVIVNPILGNLKWTKFLDGETIWKDIQNYISSLANDKDVDISVTDKDKIVMHGFDNKSSFRNSTKL